MSGGTLGHLMEKGWLGVGSMMLQKSLKPQQPAALQGAPVAPIVDPASKATNNLGRAALISTSPQGVQGTSPTGRMTLLGN